jgi:integrase
MSVSRATARDGRTVYRVRWREGGRGSRQRSRDFARRRDADLFEADIKRRKQLGTIALLDAGTITLDEYVTTIWAKAHAATLAPKTRQVYAWAYDRHIGPRVGGVPLAHITPDVVARVQADLLAAGAGHDTVSKAMTLLGGILQRAAEAQLIAYNAARLVRRAPAPMRDEVRPLAPATVEALRAACGPRDAMVVSLLAYAGLRPQELRGLRWAHVQSRTLIVGAPKTHSRRNVRLLAPLKADLAEWRMAQGRPPDWAPVVCGQDAGPWTAEGFNRWRAGRPRRAGGPLWGWASALDAVGIHARPYDLRHSFASLLLHEGRSVIYVARQLGHGAELTMRAYGHVIEELEDTPRIAAEEAIRRAREERGVRQVRDSGAAT